MVGRYASPELGGSTWEVEAVTSGASGTLQLRRPRAAVATLVPLDSAWTYSDGAGLVLHFDKTARGKSAGFRLDANRVSNIRFDRVM